MSDEHTAAPERDLPDASTQSFIVKIWLEELAGANGPAVWRGHITHVPSGARRHIQDLEAIARFMAPYLVALGIVLPPS